MSMIEERLLRLERAVTQPLHRETCAYVIQRETRQQHEAVVRCDCDIGAREGKQREAINAIRKDLGDQV